MKKVEIVMGWDAAKHLHAVLLNHVHSCNTPEDAMTEDGKTSMAVVREIIEKLEVVFLKD